MIKAVLVDDEHNAVINLENIIKQNFSNDVMVAGYANSVEEAELLISKTKPDLVFLDIEMPHKSGFDLLKKLNDIEFEVIFVTAYSNYGIDAIKFSALDYILKPIDIKELGISIQKAKSRIEEKKVNLSLHNLMNYFKFENEKSKHKIAITSLKETRFVPVHQILYCESKNSYTTIFLDNGDEIVSTVPIYEYESLLVKYDFIRCHQSFLVNKNFVKSFKKENGNVLLLSNNIEIPVSRQKKDEVTKSLMNFF